SDAEARTEFSKEASAQNAILIFPEQVLQVLALRNDLVSFAWPKRLGSFHRIPIAFCRPASAMEQLIRRLPSATRGDRRGQPLASLLLSLLDQRFDRARGGLSGRGERGVAAPVMHQTDQLSETLRVQRLDHRVGCLLALHSQLGLNGRGNRAKGA